MITHTGKCEGCKAAEEKAPSETWQPIGEEVYIRDDFAGDTSHVLLQCTVCGSGWIRIRDMGGRGGKGTFYHPMTNRFY